MKLETCIETLAEAKSAAAHNINRVELCAALDLGGLTPSAALIEASSEIIETHVMIRLRAGDFEYTTAEILLMAKDIIIAKEFGAVGVVFGCLLGAKIDLKNTAILKATADNCGLQSTFHRAFDFVENQPETLEELINLNFDRLLTSGSKPTAFEGIENIKNMVDFAYGRIEIMAGSGVNAQNALALKNLGVDALHFSIRKKTGQRLSLGMGDNYEVDEEKMKEILEFMK